MTKREALTRRITAGLLAIFICLAALPFSSFAAPEETEENSESQMARWTELEERRESASRTFLSETGEEVVAVYPYPVFYRDGGDWIPYDYRLELVSDEEEIKEYQVRDGSMETFVRRFFSGGDFLRVDYGEEGGSMALALPVTNSARSRLPEFKVQTGLYDESGSRSGRGQETQERVAAEYIRNYGFCEEALNGVDVGVEQWPGNVEVSFYMKTAGRAKDGLTLSLSLEGLTFQEDEDGSLHIFEGQKEKALLKAPVIYDGKRALGKASYLISEREDGAFQIVVMPEEEWLGDFARISPITIQMHLVQSGMEEGISTEVQSTGGYFSGLPIAAGNTKETIQTKVTLPVLPALSEGKTMDRVNLVFGQSKEFGEPQGSLELGVYSLSSGKAADTPMDSVSYEADDQIEVCMLDVTRAYGSGTGRGGEVLLRSVQTELVTGVYGFDFFVSDMLLPMLLVSSTGAGESGSQADPLVIGEDVGRRDSFTKHFLTEDGGYVAAVYEMPVHYEKDGNWEEIDNRLVRTDNGEDAYVNRASDQKVKFSRYSSASELVAMESPSGAFSWSLLGEEQEVSESPETGTAPGDGTESGDESSREGGESAEESSEGAEDGREQESGEEETETESGTGDTKQKGSEFILAPEGEDDREEEASSNGRYLEFGKDRNGKSVSLYNIEQMKRTGLTSGGTYEGIQKEVDIRYVMDSVELKESVLFHSKSAARTSLQFRISHPGLDMSLEKDGSAVLKRGGETVYVLSAPYMYDWAGNTSTDASLKLEKEKDGVTVLTVEADPDWLTDKERTYPVAIERTIGSSAGRKAVQSASIREKQAEEALEKATPLTVGYLSGYGVSRTLLKLLELPELEAGERIYRGVLNLYQNQYSSGKTEGFSVIAHGISEDWVEDVTWNTQPLFDEKVLDSQTAGRMRTAALDSREEDSEAVSGNTEEVEDGESESTGSGDGEEETSEAEDRDTEEASEAEDRDTEEASGEESRDTEGDFGEEGRDASEGRSQDTKESYGGSLELKQFDITSRVEAWYGGENHGVILGALTETVKAGACYTVSNRSSRQELYPLTCYPTGLFYYRRNTGLGESQSAHVQENGQAGTGYVDDFTGNLTFIHEDAGEEGDRLPGGLAHVYNLERAGENSFYGNGWRLNVSERLEALGLSGIPYIYTDETGSERLLYKDGTDGNKLRDKDGLTYTVSDEVASEGDGYRVLTDPEGNERFFDGNGFLRRKKTADGSELFYGCNEDGRLENISDGDGSLVSFRYDESGTKLLSLTDERAGKTTGYQYDQLGNLTGILHPDGKLSSYFYHEKKLIRVKTADQAAVEYLYAKASGTERVHLSREWGTNGAVSEAMAFSYKETHATSISLQKEGEGAVYTYAFDRLGKTLTLSDEAGRGNEYIGAETAEDAPSGDGALRHTASNYLKNSGFASGDLGEEEDWYEYKYEVGKKPYAEIQTDMGRSDGRSAFISRKEAGTGIIAVAQDVEGLPAGVYTASAYVRPVSLDFAAEAKDGGALLGITFLSGEKANMTEYGTERLTDASHQDWQRVTVTFTVPEDGTDIRLWGGLQNVGGQVYLDDFQLEEGEDAGAYNLLNNGSFEKKESRSGISGWNSRSLGQKDGFSSEESRLGNASARISGTGKDCGSISQTVAISGKEGDRYYLSGWARADAVASGEFRLGVEIFYSDGSRGWNYLEFDPSRTGWQYVGETFTVEDGSEKTDLSYTGFTVHLFYGGQYHPAWFDGIQLIKL